MDYTQYALRADTCVVPEGKAGSYGHRALLAVLLGCVPLITKERYSYEFFHEALNWTSAALFVPPVQMPRLLDRLPSGTRHGRDACSHTWLCTASSRTFTHTSRCTTARVFAIASARNQPLRTPPFQGRHCCECDVPARGFGAGCSGRPFMAIATWAPRQQGSQMPSAL